MRLVVALAITVGVPACTAGSASHIGQSSSYKLYTSCGVREARIGNDFFIADRPIDRGNGNRVPGWGYPYQRGRMKRVSATTAVFTDGRGHRVVFHLRPGATAFEQPCL